MAAGKPGVWIFTPSSPLSVAQYTLTFSVSDVAGDLSAASSPISFSSGRFPILCLVGQTVRGDEQAGTIKGSDGNDRLFGADGWDLMNGGNGNDIWDGGVGRDTLIGGGGGDKRIGDRGRDVLYGDQGNDWLGEARNRIPCSEVQATTY